MTPIRHIIIAATTIVASALATNAQNVLQMRDTITDPNFVYPESYEADTHRLMQDWYLKAYTSLDRPATATANVAATPEEYVRRLQAMPTVVEMPYNSIVRGCIDMYVERRRGQVERMLGLSSYYEPIFIEALEAEGVPLELRFLPIIESALDPNAVSRAGATGLWQFMAPTGKGLGLEISSLVDERRDPVRSSRMAARYLKQLHDIYDDWSLAIAAYNCGPGNVNKALKRAGEGKKDFWEIYPYLPAETRGYLPGFIAANYAMTYYPEHGISPVLAKRPVVTDSIHVSKRVHFQQIADVLGMPIDEIRLLNPQYRQDLIPGDVKPYPLVLPSQQALAYIMSEDSIVSHNAYLYARRGVVEPADGSSRISDDGNYIIKEVTKYHKVRRGETFNSIARRYGVTVASIKRVNGIKTLRRGRTIKIVTTERIARPADQIEPADSINVAEETIPVTFDAAADSLNIPNPAIPDDADLDINDDDAAADDSDEAANDDIKDAEATHAAVGTSAVAPTANVTPSSVAATADTPTTDNTSDADRRIRDTFASRPDPAQAKATGQETPAEQPRAGQPRQQQKQQAKPVYVKVKKGDTMSKIARNNSTTLQKLQQLNPSINASRIKPGDRIRVK